MALKVINVIGWVTGTQSIILNGDYSEFLPVESGILQGTVLGPIMFSLYINDVGDISLTSTSTWELH